MHGNHNSKKIIWKLLSERFLRIIVIVNKKTRSPLKIMIGSRIIFGLLLLFEPLELTLRICTVALGIYRTQI